jgi:hypothetical protein
MTPLSHQMGTWLLARLLLSLWLMSFVLHTERANGQSGLDKTIRGWGNEGDACLAYFEGHSVRFNAFQESSHSGSDGQSGFFSSLLESSNCTELRATGPATVTIDLMDRKLRETPVSFKIIDPLGDGPRKLLTHLPSQVYPRGIIETQLIFVRPGQYQAVLTYGDSAFPEHKLTLFVAESSNPIRLRDVLGVLLIALAGTLITNEVSRWLNKWK